MKVYGPKEELCEDLLKVVEAAGAAEVIDGGELWNLCGQRSKEEGGSCDASFVPSAIQIFTLSHEEESQAPSEQVRNECQNQIMAIPSETSFRFKSLNSYHANDMYLAFFQTQSEASPELLTLVRKIRKRSGQKVSNISSSYLGMEYIQWQKSSHIGLAGLNLLT